MTNAYSDSGMSAFDPVHDTQNVYRVLLEALSRPGKICRIANTGQHFPHVSAESQTAASVALTLLDGEVSFCVLPKDKALSDYIVSRTFCRPAEASVADYVFADGDASVDFVSDLMRRLRKGTLIAPETSATLLLRVMDLYEANSLNLDENVDRQYMLSGPGIKEQRTLSVRGIARAWCQERSISNAEYPLGIDLFLYTADGKIVGLPRTTKMMEYCEGE